LEKGAVFQEWLADIEEFLANNKDAEGFGREMTILADAFEAYKEMRNFLLQSLSQKPELMPLYSTRVLHSTAMVYCGMLLMEQAFIAQKRAAELGAGNPERSFYQGKMQSVRFYIRNIVPRVLMMRDIVLDADTSAIDIPEDAF